MASGEEPLSPSEINRLAALAKNGSPQEREDAWRKLEPVIKGLVKEHLRRWGVSPSNGRELVEEAPSSLWAKMNSYDVQRPFLPWASTVLKRWTIDRLKADQRTRKFRVQLDPEWGMDFPDRDEDTWEVLESPELFLVPFREADLRKLEEGLTARARILSLLIAGCHRCVPQDRWERWLNEADDIPKNIPYEQIEVIDDVEERKKFLAEWLGASVQSVRMVWNRAREVLASLDRFRQ